MTNADQIAAAIQAEVAIGIEYDADVNAENQLISEIIAKALREAHTAGFNEAKERAVEIASRESGTLQPALQSPETRTRFRVAQTIATALQAMKQGGSDEARGTLDEAIAAHKERTQAWAEANGMAGFPAAHFDGEAPDDS